MWHTFISRVRPFGRTSSTLLGRKRLRYCVDSASPQSVVMDAHVFHIRANILIQFCPKFYWETRRNHVEQRPWDRDNGHPS